MPKTAETVIPVLQNGDNDTVENKIKPNTVGPMLHPFTVMASLFRTSILFDTLYFLILL